MWSMVGRKMVVYWETMVVRDGQSVVDNLVLSKNEKFTIKIFENFIFILFNFSTIYFSIFFFY